MGVMNVWNNITVIQTSDFGRTLNPNGGDGTDHAWGGNYMMMGKCIQIMNCFYVVVYVSELDGANSVANLFFYPCCRWFCKGSSSFREIP